MNRELFVDETKSAEHDFGIDYEETLNPQQQRAVTYPGGPMLVIAGAGSGKTRTLTYRVAHLVERGISPDRILLLTFTNKAAREMLNRVKKLTDGEGEGIWGGTFHHIANRILRRYASHIGYDHQYSILDQKDAQTLLDDCVTELGLDEKEPPLPQKNILFQMYSLSQNTLTPIKETIQERYPKHEEHINAVQKLRDHYQKRKEELNVMDFDDLLVNLHRLLKENDKIAEKYDRRFQHVLVDEYQDTNKVQGEITDLLTQEYNNLMVVGDDAQSIYSFRGADFQNIIRFDDRHPDAEVFKLEINYRSIPEILDLSNASIRHNQFQYPKELKAVRDSGYIPMLVTPETEEEEADFVATHVRRLREEEDISFDNQAVLYRSHHHAMVLQMELANRGIPFTVRSGLRFFEQAHIKDITAFLKVLTNPNDELSWKRIMKLFQGIGKKTASKIFSVLSSKPNPINALGRDEVQDILTRRNEDSWEQFQSVMEGLQKRFEDEKSPAELIDYIRTYFYEDYAFDKLEKASSRMDDLDQLARFADQQADLEMLLNELALRTNLDAEQMEEDLDEEDEERLILSTVHQAKGLEWDVVYIIGLAEGSFPHRKSKGDPEQEEEERRLFYVACTRARDELYMTYPLYSYRRGGGSMNNPSKFIKELDNSTYEEAQLTRT